jgi:hypothetical protein
MCLGASSVHYKFFLYQLPDGGEEWDQHLGVRRFTFLDRGKLPAADLRRDRSV